MSDKLSTKDIKIIKELKALTGVSESQISSIFLNLANMIGIGNYYNGETITIPYFGTFKLKFEGNGENREAKVTGFFSLDDNIKRNVGIIEDFKATEDEKILLDLDAFTQIKKETRLNLSSIEV